MLLLCPFFEFFGLKMMKKRLAFDENIQVSFSVIFSGARFAKYLLSLIFGPLDVPFVNIYPANR